MQGSGHRTAQRSAIEARPVVVDTGHADVMHACMRSISVRAVVFAIFSYDGARQTVSATSEHEA